MTNRKTYRVFEEDERELVYEDILDNQGQTLSYKDYQSPNQAEEISEYDPKGNLVLEKEIVEGVEGSRTEYTRNANGDIINSKLFIADELFEETNHEFLANGYPTTLSYSMVCAMDLEGNSEPITIKANFIN